LVPYCLLARARHITKEMDMTRSILGIVVTVVVIVIVLRLLGVV
jgi:hypothetical protein